MIGLKNLGFWIRHQADRSLGLRIRGFRLEGSGYPPICAFFSSSADQGLGVQGFKGLFSWAKDLTYDVEGMHDNFCQM